MTIAMQSITAHLAVFDMPTAVAFYRDVLGFAVITTLYIGCPDVDGAYAELRSKGVDAQPPEVSWYGMKQLYVKDPDGYRHCFQSPA